LAGYVILKERERRPYTILRQPSGSQPLSTFWNHYCLAELFRDEGGFDDATAHIEEVKPYTTNNTYNTGHTMEMQAQAWCRQGGSDNATSQALCALGIFEKWG
jgi:hypothetical protein